MTQIIPRQGDNLPPHANNESGVNENVIPSDQNILSEDTKSTPPSGGNGSSDQGENPETGFSLTPSDQEVVNYSIGIDWLTVSYELPSDELFHGFHKGIFGDYPYIVVEQSVRLSADKSYPYSIRSGLSVQAAYEKTTAEEEKIGAGEAKAQVRGAFEKDKNGTYKGFVQLRGKYWEKLTIGEMMEVLNHCEYYRCSYSRVDLRLDDWNYNIFPYQEMMGAWEKGDIAGFKKAGYNQEGTPDNLNWRYSFGGRKSEAYTRGYNHDWGEDESVSQRESHRHEVEFKGKKAKEVIRLLCGFKPDSGSYPSANLYEGFSKIEAGDTVTTMEGDQCKVIEWNYHNECFVVEYASGRQDSFYPCQLTPSRSRPVTWEDKISDFIVSLIVGQIDFVNKSEKQGKRVNKKDCTRLEFWQQVLDKLRDGVRLVVTRNRPSLETTIDWLKRQVAPTLAIFFEGMGESEYMGFLSHLIAAGKEKWKDKHENLSNTISLEIEKGMFLY